MSKLADIRDALKTNPDVIIVNVEERSTLDAVIRRGLGAGNYFNSSTNRNTGNEFYEVHQVDFKVAPRTELSGEDELQRFMMGLTPEVQPTNKFDFEQTSTYLRFGHLYFDEIIGRENRTVTLVVTDEQLLKAYGLVDGKKTIDTPAREYKRSIWLHLYPSEEVANAVLYRRLKYPHEISLEDSRKNPELVQKLLVRELFDFEL